MNRKIVASLLAVLALVSGHGVEAQQGKVHRVGVIFRGNEYVVVDGLEEGLKELGFTEDKEYVLHVRDLKVDLDAVEPAAKSLEGEKMDLVYSVSTSVTTEVKGATTKVPVVFAVGTDPVAAGLVESFSRPGGRLTGVYYSSADLTAKRLEILKAILPKLRRVAIFYSPTNRTTMLAIKSARDAARQLQIEIVERQVPSVRELRLSVAAFKPQEADAFFYVNDAMVRSQSQFIIDTMKAKKVPTMFATPDVVAQGALVGYGVGFREAGLVSARYVHKVLSGASPKDLPVESVSRVGLAVNLNTARDIGVTIPQAVRLSASEVIQ